MSRIQRFLARLIDYSVFYGLIVLFYDFIQASLLSYIGAFLFLPLLFVPFEVLQLKFFQTTFGKWIFGFKYEKKISFESAIKLATKKAILIEPLLLPPVNPIFIALFLKELKKYPTNRWDAMDGLQVVKKKRKKLWHALVISFGLVFTTIVLTPNQTTKIVGRITGIEVPALFPSTTLFAPSEWVKVTDDKLSFLAFFPREPEFKEKDLPLPKSDKTLNVKEFSHEDQLNYSLLYADLPSSWTFFGSSMVFKSVSKLIEKHEGKILTKQNCKHGSYPALAFLAKKGDGQVMGKLILVKNTLYKIAVTSKTGFSDEEKQKANEFIESFNPS